MGLNFHFIGTLSVYSIDLIDTVREKEGCRFTNLPSKPFQTCYNTLQFQSESVFSRAFLYSCAFISAKLKNQNCVLPNSMRFFFSFNEPIVSVVEEKKNKESQSVS